MKEQEVFEIFNRVGALITNSHFVYTSGKHGTTYINKDAIYPHTAETSRLCRAIAEQFADDDIKVVIAPAIGGVILSQWTAYHLTKMGGHEVLGVYAEKEGTELISSGYGSLPPKYEDKFVIKRGYDKLIANKRILVVEDVLTTGGSAKKVVEITRTLGGNVVGLATLCNRGGITPQDVANVPKLVALVNVKFETLNEDECLRTGPCSQGIPVNTDIGKGREFLARKQT